MTETDIAYGIATNKMHRWHYTKMLVVRNVTWGLGFLYELDLLAVSKTGVGHEIEIKVSVSDLKRDQLKRHQHDSPRIKYLWFAGPVEMRESFLDLVPSRAGIILYDPRATNTRAELDIVRNAKKNAYAKDFTDEERFRLARLGTMRYWTRISKEQGE